MENSSYLTVRLENEMIEISSALLRVDYITATAKTYSQRLAFETIASCHLTNSVLDGKTIGSFGFAGYRGWKDSQFAYGERHDGSVIRAWGDTSDDLWREVALQANSVSRLDICVDCLLQTPRVDLAVTGYRLAGGSDKRRRLTLITNNDGGQTLYLGSRSSNKMGRLYDKGVQQKSHTPGSLWRYEIEYKGDLASYTAKAILKLDYAEQVDLMGYLVWDTFTDNRVQVLFPKTPGFIQAMPRRDSLDDQQLLDWLRKQIRPSVARLISIGKRRDVLLALGLD